MRISEFNRKTKETDIKVKIDLDNSFENKIDTGIGFFNHMLTALAVHSEISMNIAVKGDLDVDGHHTVEDTGIVLGKAFRKALSDKKGLARYGMSEIPMDEALCKANCDISGRPFLIFNAEFFNEKIGDYEACLTEEFFRAFAFNAEITLHINILYGKNDHHKCEAMFKAVAHSLKQAVKIEGNTLLSTKGVI